MPLRSPTGTGITSLGRCGKGRDTHHALTLTLTFTLRSTEEVVAFEAVLGQVAQAAAGQAGCTRYEILRVVGGPGLERPQYTVIESWASLAALNTHLETPSVVAANAALVPLLHESVEARTHVPLAKARRRVVADGEGVRDEGDGGDGGVVDKDNVGSNAGVDDEDPGSDDDDSGSDDESDDDDSGSDDESDDGSNSLDDLLGSSASL
ncbi:uncharacterized protein AMSG_02120 [Thecamonas trahens ATCC 50062]|uniref:ABM domain-containing protein n=1 Tax=Thecamonas trahens ATCC 50062 TaxID=461836 RepID=A0A0L0DVK9_THETB|nr:hypothetical protein AMSG_02120 [Thecamonas trahens ATCC 50062]KNC56106.1 hypothetical protein AMSG_02120 [Thecamonas trahens ATCC 50062]|eukprot:XP_013761148.1 hypothetical protein AMSG_02120 [Thecamonas trahens ATCC 50062]